MILIMGGLIQGPGLIHGGIMSVFNSIGLAISEFIYLLDVTLSKTVPAFEFTL